MGLYRERPDEGFHDSFAHSRIGAPRSALIRTRRSRRPRPARRRAGGEALFAATEGPLDDRGDRARSRAGRRPLRAPAPRARVSPATRARAPLPRSPRPGRLSAYRSLPAPRPAPAMPVCRCGRRWWATLAIARREVSRFRAFVAWLAGCFDTRHDALVPPCSSPHPTTCAAPTAPTYAELHELPARRRRRPGGTVGVRRGRAVRSEEHDARPRDEAASVLSGSWGLARRW